jgi:hypothetical protein
MENMDKLAIEEKVNKAGANKDMGMSFGMGESNGGIGYKDNYHNLKVLPYYYYYYIPCFSSLCMSFR